MQVKVENLSGLERKLNITLPPDAIEDKIKSRLNEMAARVRIPGFRPGKVPFDIMQKRYGESARAGAIEDLIKDSYHKALSGENLNPAGLPAIDIVSSKPGEHLTYTATFEVYPEIKLIDLKQIAVEKPVAQVSDTDVDEMLERMAKAHVKWQEVKDPARKAQIGDRVTLDYTYAHAKEGTEVKEHTDKDVKFVLGAGQMWKEFEDPLHGTSAGEEKVFTLKLPDTHLDKNLAGAETRFNVKIHKVCEPIYPALNDEFASSMKVEGGLDGLKKEVHSHMDRELQSNIKERLKEKVMEKLLEHHAVDVPKVMLERELERQAQAWRNSYSKGRSGEPKEIPEFPRADYDKIARRNVALGLLLSELAQKHGIKVTPDEVYKKIEAVSASYYADKDKALERMLSDKNYIARIEADILEDKLLDHIASQVNITDKSASYKELVSRK